MLQHMVNKTHLDCPRSTLAAHTINPKLAELAAGLRGQKLWSYVCGHASLWTHSKNIHEKEKEGREGGREGGRKRFEKRRENIQKKKHWKPEKSVNYS